MSAPARTSGRSGDAASSAACARHRTQVREQLERRSQAEQRVLRARGCRRVIPSRAADRAEQDRIGGAAGVQGFVRQRLAGGIDRRTTDLALVPAHLEPEPGPGGIDAASRHVADLGPDPVAGQVGDAVLPHGWLPAGVGTGSPPARRWRAASTASAATGCSAISLLTAAR